GGGRRCCWSTWTRRRTSRSTSASIRARSSGRATRCCSASTASPRRSSAPPRPGSRSSPRPSPWPTPRSSSPPPSDPNWSCPSRLALGNAEIQRASPVGRELLLRDALDDCRGPQPSPKADFVLIDCPPSLGILTMNALCASTDVLLPIQAEFFALQGVAGILESLKAVQRLNRGLKLSMFVPCLGDKRR